MANLNFMDLTGSVVGLIYNKKRRYESTFGGFISIMMILGIIAVTLIYLNEFFGRKKPKMSFEDMKYWDPPSVDISSGFQFSIIMNYKGKSTIRNNIIKIDAVYVSNNSTQSKDVSLPFIPCSSNTVDQINSTFTPELSNALCFELTNLTLAGTKVTEIFQFIRIRFTLCVGSQECLPPDQMKQFFEDNNPVAIIYFVDTIFQTNDKQKVTYFYNSVDVNLTYGNSKETNVFFSKNELLVDNSYFFPSSPQKYSHFMIDSFRDLVSVRTDKQTEILTINLMLSKNKRIIHLSYIQISELMANISALANVIMVFSNFIGGLYNHHLFQTDLMQSLFHINNSSNNTDSINQINDILNTNQKSNLSIHSNSTQNRIITITNKNNIQTSLFKPSNHKQQEDKPVLNIINQSNHSFSFRNQKHTLQISQKDINKIITSQFIPLCCLKGFMKTKKTFEDINDFMLMYQDQKNLFRKLQEIDLMKYLLFSDEELSLYQYISKPKFIAKENHQMKERGFSCFFCKPSFHYLKCNSAFKSNIDINNINELLKNSLVNKEKKEINNRIKLCLNC